MNVANVGLLTFIMQIRQERNLTQKQLGEMVGASEAYIRAYESGTRNTKPSPKKK